MKLLLLLSLQILSRRADSQCHPAEYGAVLSYGESCQHMCRCLGNEQCDHVTGECPSGCAPGWMGRSCQYANLALNKPATQREPDESDPVFGAGSAVDGNLTTCAKSKTLWLEPRWCVNMGKIRHVVGLNIIVPKRNPVTLDRFIIYISNVSYESSPEQLSICYWQDGSQPSDVNRMNYEIMCYQPLIGQFLIIHKRGRKITELELCEVQVYGGRDLGFRKPSVLSSIQQAPSTGAVKAVNGRLVDTDIMQCTVSKLASDPAWTVDLGMNYKIHRIAIHNQETEEKPEFEIVMNTVFPSVSESVFSYDGFFINKTTEVNLLHPVIARYITIGLTGQNKQLVLCEVDIFGDCQTNQCGSDCSASCWCNNTVTGDALFTATCPYKCSDDVHDITMPHCTKAPASKPSTMSPDQSQQTTTVPYTEAISISTAPASKPSTMSPDQSQQTTTVPHTEGISEEEILHTLQSQAGDVTTPSRASLIHRLNMKSFFCIIIACGFVKC